jgi:hypothetical protein
MNAPEPEAAPAVIIIDMPDPQSWAELVMRLREAAEIDRRGMGNADLPTGLAGPLSAMHHLVVFLLKQRSFMAPAADDLAPVIRLYTAMIDVLNGRPHPMFTPLTKSDGGRPGNAMAFEAIKGQAARALTEAMRAGVPKKEAAMKVARACGVLPGYGLVTGRNVISWRDRLQGKPGPGAPKDGAARFAYWKPLPAEMGGTAQQRADNLIEDLRKYARTILSEKSHEPHEPLS